MPTITFKVSVEEARLLRARARASSAASLSEYLRKVTLEPVVERKRVFTRDKLTGLMVDTTPGPIVTDQDVRDALENFP